MSNQRIADLIAKALQEGFIHPGDPDKGIPETPILLPFKPSPGMPKEMGDLMSGTVKLLSECIVSLIETEGDSDIVPKAEVRTMRHAFNPGDAAPRMPVYCHCDKIIPLMVLSVRDPAHVVVDGRSLIRGLSTRGAQCPHPYTAEMSEAEELNQMTIGVMDGLLKKDLSTKGREIIGKEMHQFLYGPEVTP